MILISPYHKTHRLENAVCGQAIRINKQVIYKTLLKVGAIQQAVFIKPNKLAKCGAVVTKSASKKT